MSASPAVPQPSDDAVRLAALARAVESFGAVFGDGTLGLEEMRANLDAMMTASPLDADVTTSTLAVGGVETLRVSAGAVDEQRALVWLHGGGYVMGSPVGYAHAAAAVSRALGVPVLLPDYRRAPESPFPAALDDATAVLEALMVELGPERVALAGDSAGGGLTLATLVNLRDRGADLPAAAVAVSPLADFTASGASFASNDATDPVIRPQSLPMLGAAYLRRGDRQEPLASPVFADLGGLPPVLLLASDSETLLDDALTLHRRIRTAGGSSALLVQPDTCHAWTLFTEFLPQAREGVEQVARFVRRHLS